MRPQLQSVPDTAPKTMLHNICSLPDAGAKPSGDARATSESWPVTSQDNRRNHEADCDFLLSAISFKKFCKNLLAIAFHGCLTLGNAVRRSGLDRPAHKLVEVIISRLDAELVSVRSFLPPGILLWRFDPEVVALNNAINLVNQAQTETRPCWCCYCAGAPFYASKKPVASVGLAKAKAAGL